MAHIKITKYIKT